MKQDATAAPADPAPKKKKRGRPRKIKTGKPGRPRKVAAPSPPLADVTNDVIIIDG